MDSLIWLGISLASLWWVRSSFRDPVVSLTKQGVRFRAGWPIRIFILLCLGACLFSLCLAFSEWPGFDAKLMLGCGLLGAGLLAYIYPPEITVGKTAIRVRPFELLPPRKIPFALIHYVVLDATNNAMVINCVPSELGWRCRPGLFPGLEAVAELLRQRGVKVVNAV